MCCFSPCELPLSNVLNIVGLLIDVIGVCLLFKNGLPFNPNILDSYTVIEIKKSELPKLNKEKFLAKLGLFLLLLGFCFQVVGSFIK